MPRLTIRKHGASASIPRSTDEKKKPEDRKANRGWTMAVARRNAQFLQRIDFGKIEGRPYAITLTAPVDAMSLITPDMMHRWIDTMLKYLRRRGLIHFHWVIEFTANHMPHIHMTVWMAAKCDIWNPYRRCHEIRENDLATVTAYTIMKWLNITHAEDINTSSRSQDVQNVDGNEAWLAYVAKHTQRGVRHYQRALNSMPENWKDTPGAMWGHSRDIPIIADAIYPMSMRAFHQFRREIRKWCSAQASCISDPKRRARAIRQARRMNRCTTPELSVVRPSSVWIPDNVTKAICRSLRRRGYMIGVDAYEWGIGELRRLRQTGENPVKQQCLEQELVEMMRW